MLCMSSMAHFESAGGRLSQHEETHAGQVPQGLRQADKHVRPLPQLQVRDPHDRQRPGLVGLLGRIGMKIGNHGVGLAAVVLRQQPVLVVGLYHDPVRSPDAIFNTAFLKPPPQYVSTRVE